MLFSRFFKKILIWRMKHISRRPFMLMMSVIVGIASGLGAVIIKNSVHLIKEMLKHGVSHEYSNYLYLIYPVIGISLAVIFIKYILKQPVHHGIPTVLHSIAKQNGKIKPHNMFSSIITSALTVGFGGSIGLEGPTVATGAAIGANIGRLFHLNYKQITLLLGCASTGAMAAIFKAPIAGVVFTLEVIMIDLTTYSLVPLLLASISGTVVSYLFLGQTTILSPSVINKTFDMANIPYYIALGVIAGLVSVYFTRMFMFIENFFKKIQSLYKKLLIGALSLGTLIFFFPALYGEGYDAINSCLSGNYNFLFDNSVFAVFSDNFIVLILILLSIILLKVVATSVTFGSGGVGGIFAPTLFIGSNVGLFFSLIVNRLGLTHLSRTNFALIGMAGLIAGVLQAPLTGIFLIADITGGYQLFMPLMITAAFSFITVRLFERNSVYTIQLANRNELITHDKDKAVLSRMKVTSLIETNFSCINSDATLGDLVQVISKSSRNLFPVLEDDGTFLGIVFVNDIRHIIFKPELYDTTYVRDLMFMPEPSVDPDELMESVAEKFQISGNFNLPVLKDGKYLGFVSRAKVFSSYRRLLKRFSED